MQVSVKLMGALKDKMPGTDRLDLVEGATIDDALRALEIPVENVQVFTVNGTLERDRGRSLPDGDELPL